MSATDDGLIHCPFAEVIAALRHDVAYGDGSRGRFVHHAEIVVIAVATSGCEAGAVADDWIEIGWVQPQGESEHHAEASRLLDAWLAQHRVSRAALADEDIRTDLVYLGLGKGCDIRVLVRRAGVEGATADPIIEHLADLESPWDASGDHGYDPVALVRHALSWPTDYWPGLALRWLDQGLPAEELLDELRRFEGESHRPQSQRHHARSLRTAAGG